MRWRSRSRNCCSTRCMFPSRWSQDHLTTDPAGPHYQPARRLGIENLRKVERAVIAAELRARHYLREPCVVAAEPRVAVLDIQRVGRNVRIGCEPIRAVGRTDSVVTAVAAQNVSPPCANRGRCGGRRAVVLCPLAAYSRPWGGSKMKRTASSIPGCRSDSRTGSDRYNCR